MRQPRRNGQAAVQRQSRPNRKPQCNASAAQMPSAAQSQPRRDGQPGDQSFTSMFSTKQL